MLLRTRPPKGEGGTGPPSQAMPFMDVVARMAVENVTRGREIDIENITPVGVAV